MPEVMRVSDLNELADQFSRQIAAIKARRVDVNWYPYDTMANIGFLLRLLPPDVLEEVRRNQLTILDVGAGDGDVAFFLESLGCSVDVIDQPRSNFNGCVGLAALKAELNSSVALDHRDVDGLFAPARNYDIVLALGILYHLRNPFAFLISIASCCERLILSTRVARATPQGMTIGYLPVAYLLAPGETNNDSTNFWIFTPEGLKRLLERCGWRVISKLELGDTIASSPVDRERDERHFVFCERIDNWRSAIDCYAV
jgi:2-polyprenyl-3-methyl-5-hydroxy-6-metoxy-1,4-benzoquinol methylase